MRVKLTLRSAEGERDVEVTADRGATVGQLAPLLGAVLADAASVPLFSEGRLLPAQASLGEPGLRSGCVIDVSGNVRRSPPGGAALQLRVISGPDSGTTIGLLRGCYLIGRGRQAHLDLTDPDVSRRHAELRVDADGISIRDLGSTNGTWLEGSPVAATACAVEQGAVLRLGNSSVQLIAAATEPPAAVTTDAAGRVQVHRPPSIAEPCEQDPVEFPAEPVEATRPRVPWLAGLAPAALGIGCAILMHNSQFLVFALLSPVTVLAGAAVDRREWRRGRRRARTERARAEAAARERLEARLAAERIRLHRDFPDAAAVLHTTSLPDCRLWERRPGERRFLTIRLGLTDRAAETRAARAGRLQPVETIASAPATVSLRDGALGLAGPLPLVRGVARWVVGQLLALHSPRDLSTVAFLDGEVADWRWLRWPEATVRAVATEPHAHRSLSKSLRELVTERRTHTAGSWPGPWVVVLLDRAGRFAALDDLRAVLEEGPAVGVTAVCVDTDVRTLPPSCRSTAVLVSDHGSGAELRRAGHATAQLAAERVSAEWADRLARSLAPLHDTDPDDEQLPADVWLADLLGEARLGTASLVRRWMRPGPAATPIGLAAGGPVEFDLVRDGPHLLIAGATGAGKSELLRSLVTGLAVRHAPDDLAFVLVDYKGGAAFGGCAAFPHTAGLVTDLDAHLTSRALTSLNAEIRRREVLLAEAGVAEFDDYQRLPGTRQRRLARLVLVVDEFAHLAEELPAFLSGLIAVAQRGRSLGLHLVLATQRPAGVVSPQIKANISARIALRVTDAADSTDVIGCGAASRIPKSRPGRGFAQLAAGLTEFQTALSGQRPRPAGSVTVTPLDSWHRAVTGSAAPPAAGGVEECQPVQAALWQAVAELGRALPESPWLPPLPVRLTTADLVREQAPAFEIRFGLTDDPRCQRQYPASHDLLAGGSLGFIGGPRSGRTTALHTFLGQACRQLGPDQLHLYLLDCAGQSFGHFARLPHCGAVVGAHEPGSVARLLARLVEELAARQRLLAELGLATLAEAHLTGTPLPVIVVALDGWEGLSALSDDHDSGRSAEALLRLARDGAAAGITVLVAGDRAVLGLRVAPALGRRLLLRLADRGDYLTAGVSSTSLPARFEPGRAVTADEGLEIQLALLTDDTGPGAQRAAVEALSTLERAATAGPTIRIRSLPVSVRQAELVAGTADRNEPAVRVGHCLLGLGGDDAQPIWAALFVEHARFLISGPPSSGRSTTAVVIAQQAWQAGLTMLIAAPTRSPLADWAGQRELTVLTPECPSPHSDPARDTSPGQLVLIDDVERFDDTAGGSYLTELATSSRAAVIAAGRAEDLLTSFRGPAVAIRRRRTGLLLQPGPADGELLGIRTGGQRMAPVPGRGLLVTDTTRRTATDGLALQVAI